MSLKKTLLITAVGFSFNFSFSQNIEFSKENFKDRKDELKAALKDIEKGDEFMHLETYQVHLEI